MNSVIVDNECSLKDRLQGIMERLLELLREVLASVHEERLMLDREEMSSLKELLERRQNLLDAFESSHQHFVEAVNALSRHPLKVQSLVECLERLHNDLKPEDVELLLLVSQLSCISKEMQGETNTLVHLLEHKSTYLSSYGLPLKKIAPQPLRVAIGLADDDEMQ